MVAVSWRQSARGGARRCRGRRGRRGDRLGRDEDAGRTRSVSGSDHVRRRLDRRRGANAFAERDRRLQQAVPERQGQLQAGRATTCRRCSRPRSPAAIRRTWRTSRSRASSSSSSEQGTLKPITYAKSVISENFAPAWVKLGTFNGKLYALVFKATNKSTRLVQRPRLQDGRRQAAEDLVAAHRAPRRRSRRPARRPTRSAAPTAGRSPTCSRTSTCARSGRRSTTQLSAHKIKWTDPSVTTALKTMEQIIGDARTSDGGTSGRRPDRLPDLGQQRLPDAAEGGDGVRGRLRRRRDPQATKAKPKTDFNVVPVPVDQRRGECERRRDRRRHDRHVPGHAGDRGVREVPRARRQAAEIWAQARRLRDRQQERAGERLSRRDHARDRSADRRRRRRSCSTCPTSSPPRSARRRARASGGSSRSSCRTRATSTSIQQQLEAAATSGVQEGK